MKWKFWKKNSDKDETSIQVTVATPGAHHQIYISAQTSEKALELYKKLKEEG